MVQYNWKFIVHTVHTVLDIEFYKVVINTENVKYVNYLFYVFNAPLVKTVFCAKFCQLMR